MSYASLKTLRPFFTNKCGRLLAGGKIHTYEVGTLTPKATYKDAAGLTENTNPIVLDVSGEADIYINSDYRFQIFDRDGVLIDDVDSVAPTQRISSAFLIDESGFTQAQINATKEDTLNKGAANGYPSLDENTKVPTEQQYSASTTQPGIVQLVNDLTTGGTGRAITAEQGKLLLAMFANSLGSNGRINLPNPTDINKPIIIQWGIVFIPGNSNQATVSYSIALPNDFLGGVCNMSNNTTPIVFIDTSFSKTSVTVRTNTNTGAGVQSARYIAIGY